VYRRPARQSRKATLRIAFDWPSVFINTRCQPCSTTVLWSASTLSIKTDGDKLAGTMTYQGKREAKLKDPKFKDGELTFSVDLEWLDMTFTIEYKLKVQGEMLKGKGAVEVRGEKRSIDIEGKREKKGK
jgi:hypothetical protein